jgi:hypothetical protein
MAIKYHDPKFHSVRQLHHKSANFLTHFAISQPHVSRGSVTAIVALLGSAEYKGSFSGWETASELEPNTNSQA